MVMVSALCVPTLLQVHFLTSPAAPVIRVANVAFQKILELREVLNIRVTVGHRPAQAQEEPAG